MSSPPQAGGHFQRQRCGVTVVGTSEQAPTGDWDLFSNRATMAPQYKEP